MLAGQMAGKDHPVTAVGPKLRALRQQKGLSIRVAERSLGISHSRLNDFEGGRTHGSDRPAIPNREVLERAARIYEAPLDLLLGLAGYPAHEPPIPAVPSEIEAEARHVASLYIRLPEQQRRLFWALAMAFQREVLKADDV